MEKTLTTGIGMFYTKTRRVAFGGEINQVHRNEKDLFPWTKDKMQSSLKNLTVSTTNANITKLTIEKTDNIDGTAIVCNRKAKMYET